MTFSTFILTFWLSFWLLDFYFDFFTQSASFFFSSDFPLVSLLLTFFVLGKDLVVTDPRGYNYPITREIEPFREKFILNTEVKSVRKTIHDKYMVATNKGNYIAKHKLIFVPMQAVTQHITKANYSIFSLVDPSHFILS